MHHRRIAKRLGISLSEESKKLIDSRLDGFDEDYTHDLWKYDISDFKEVVEWAVGTYGYEGVKYCFLHMLLDTVQERTVSQSTRETSGARISRPIAHKIAFHDSCILIGQIVKDYLGEYYTLWEQIEPELMRHQDELSREMSRLLEVQSQIANVERLKMDNRRAEEMVSRYPRSKGALKKLYIGFVRRLWSKKRGETPKNEWGMQVLEEFKQKLGGMNKEASETVYRDFVDIAKRAGYMPNSSTFS